MLSVAPARPSQIRVLHRQPLRPTVKVTVHPVRPSVLDSRIVGDPWICPSGDETLSLCFNTWQMAAVRGVELDVPALNGLLDRLRNRRPRRQRLTLSAERATYQ
jgi:hypothetical protein